MGGQHVSLDGFRNRAAPLVIAGDPAGGHILINSSGMFAFDDTGAIFWELLFTGAGSPSQVIQATAQLEVAQIIPLTSLGIVNFADPAGTTTPARLTNGGLPIPYGNADRQAFTFTAQASITVAVTFAVPFAVGLSPVVQLTVEIPANLDVIANLTTAATNTGFTARLFQRGLANISGSGHLHWTATPPA
jgi:hypothetical protein